MSATPPNQPEPEPEPKILCISTDFPFYDPDPDIKKTWLDDLLDRCDYICTERILDECEEEEEEEEEEKGYWILFPV